MNVDETDALLRSVETQQQLTILTEALLRAVPELEGTLRDVIEENHTPGGDRLFGDPFRP